MNDIKNPELELASRIVLETGCSLFLTGKAGTGKTTFLRDLHAKTHKRMIVTAPTGIAAINAGGMTLHSFFQLDFAPFVPGMRSNSTHTKAFSKEKIRIIRGLDLLVIDEVSMVRADVLDAVDDVLRRFRDRSLPFGGVQLLLIGDLQQLPPVVVDSERHLIQSNYRSPYFFDSHALQQLDYVTIELQKVYRQSDAHFVELLNAVRDNRADAGALQRLNERYIPNFHPDDCEGYVRLTTHNHTANAINRARLDALDAEPRTFQAEVTGNFPESSYPAERELTLKVGAQVMFIKNDGEQRRYFNGMMGKVTDIDENGQVIVTPDNGDYPIPVDSVEWENVKYVVNEESKEITAKTDGVFKQLPLKTAWAITIHKSQGLTFDKAIIDASAAFAHGQTYVALSRCRSLEGMVLERPLTAQSIINDPTVSGFMQTHIADNLTEDAISLMAHAYSLRLATEMFNFRPVFNALEGVSRIYNENFMSTFPQMVMNYTGALAAKRDLLLPVYDRFVQQVRQLDQVARQTHDNSQLLKRIKDACRYFLGQLQELVKMTAEMPIDHDSKKTLIKLRERHDLFEDMAVVKTLLLQSFAEEDFDVTRYLELKAEAAFRSQVVRKKKAKTRVVRTKSQMNEDNRNPELYDLLRDWRAAKAREAALPVYTILSNKALLGVANEMPKAMVDLLSIPGIGRVKAENYGHDLITLVAAYLAKL